MASLLNYLLWFWDVIKKWKSLNIVQLGSLSIFQKRSKQCTSCSDFPPNQALNISWLLLQTLAPGIKIESNIGI